MRIALFPHAIVFGAVATLGLLALSQIGPSRAANSANADSVLSETAHRVHVVGVQRDDANDKLIVTLRIDPGFHINANPASFKYLIPTALNLAGVQATRVEYPLPTYFKPKFADDRIAVYEGTVAITAYFAPGTLAHRRFFETTVTAQACTDAICFPPADLPISIPKPSMD